MPAPPPPSGGRAGHPAAAPRGQHVLPRGSRRARSRGYAAPSGGIPSVPDRSESVIVTPAWGPLTLLPANLRGAFEAPPSLVARSFVTRRHASPHPRRRRAPPARSALRPVPAGGVLAPAQRLPHGRRIRAPAAAVPRR